MTNKKNKKNTKRKKPWSRKMLRQYEYKSNSSIKADVNVRPFIVLYCCGVKYSRRLLLFSLIKGSCWCVNLIRTKKKSLSILSSLLPECMRRKWFHSLSYCFLFTLIKKSCSFFFFTFIYCAKRVKMILTIN